MKKENLMDLYTIAQIYEKIKIKCGWTFLKFCDGLWVGINVGE
jgi:hypothetical protein